VRGRINTNPHMHLMYKHITHIVLSTYVCASLYHVLGIYHGRGTFKTYCDKRNCYDCKRMCFYFYCYVHDEEKIRSNEPYMHTNVLIRQSPYHVIVFLPRQKYVFRSTAAQFTNVRVRSIWQWQPRPFLCFQII